MEEKTLTTYCSLIAAIAVHARAKAAWDNAHFRRYYPDLQSDEIVFSNDYMSTFERVAAAFQRMDIMRSLDQCCSVFICAPEQEYELAKKNWSKGPSFSDLLETFVRLFGEFGSEHWGFGICAGSAFTPKRNVLRSAMNALVVMGYAEADGDGFCWTEAMRPIMEARDYWR